MPALWRGGKEARIYWVSLSVAYLFFTEMFELQRANSDLWKAVYRFTARCRDNLIFIFSLFSWSGEGFALSKWWFCVIKKKNERRTLKIVNYWYRIWFFTYCLVWLATWKWENTLEMHLPCFLVPVSILPCFFLGDAWIQFVFRLWAHVGWVLSLGLSLPCPARDIMETLESSISFSDAQRWKWSGVDTSEAAPSSAVFPIASWKNKYSSAMYYLIS